MVFMFALTNGETYVERGFNINGDVVNENLLWVLFFLIASSKYNMKHQEYQNKKQKTEKGKQKKALQENFML